MHHYSLGIIPHLYLSSRTAACEPRVKNSRQLACLSGALRIVGTFAFALFALNALRFLTMRIHCGFIDQDGLMMPTWTNRSFVLPPHIARISRHGQPTGVNVMPIPTVEFVVCMYCDCLLQDIVT